MSWISMPFTPLRGRPVRPRRRWVAVAGGLLLFWGTVAAGLGDPVIHHDLDVSIELVQQRLAVVDHIDLKDIIQRASKGGQQKTELAFYLHSALSAAADPPATLSRGKVIAGHGVSVARYRVSLPAGEDTLRLRYQGRLPPPADAPAWEGGAGRPDQAGIITSQGVYLDDASYWYPSFDSELVTFSMAVEEPPGWHVISQGSLDTHAQGFPRWSESQPQEAIFLIAGPYRKYTRPTDRGVALTYLRRADDDLAERYLRATEQYLDFYSRLIAPYPYAKFALVENFWESGLGMQSFTLLGPRVVRLPFIIRSSFPHEILHNWWGNGIYVDYTQGNWSEGLTAYLADHLMKERQGEGAEYRRAALQKYADYVTHARDFPLRDFRSRHGQVSQAVGYNKALMLFHMLRLRIGDAAFLRGLREFFHKHKFQRAGFADLRAAMENTSGQELSGMFSQWIHGTGAPELTLHDAAVVGTHGTYRLRARLRQVQAGRVFHVQIPLAVAMAGDRPALQTSVQMHRRELALDLPLPARPLRLVVDPEYDVFRRLAREEIPPSIGQLFGAERLVLVLPAQAPAPLARAYRALAASWARSVKHVQVTLDTALDELPAGGSVWILGWENRLRAGVQSALKDSISSWTAHAVELPGLRARRAQDAVVVVGRHPSDAGLAVAWLGSDNPAAVKGLARKLPHYGKYSYLVFTGDAPRNVLKGQWPVIHSPLSAVLTDGSARPAPLRLAPRPALGSRPGDGGDSLRN